MLKNIYVMAIEPIAGGTVTVDNLKNTLLSVGNTLVGFGGVVAFVCLAYNLVLFMSGDEQMKQQRKSRCVSIAIGLIILILLTSIINFIIGLFN